jgi:hypothetical protein
MTVVPNVGYTASWGGDKREKVGRGDVGGGLLRARCSFICDSTYFRPGTEKEVSLHEAVYYFTVTTFLSGFCKPLF